MIFVSGSPKIKTGRVFLARSWWRVCFPSGWFAWRRAETPFTIDRELDFRAMLDVPECNEGMELDVSAVMKELSFDSINNKQIAVNAEIAVSDMHLKGRLPN